MSSAWLLASHDWNRQVVELRSAYPWHKGSSTVLPWSPFPSLFAGVDWRKQSFHDTKSGQTSSSHQCFFSVCYNPLLQDLARSEMSGMSCGGSQITLLQSNFDYSDSICRADPFKSMSFVTKLRRRSFLLKYPSTLNLEVLYHFPSMETTPNYCNLSCASAQPGNLTDPDAGPDTRIFMNPKDTCLKTRHRHEILQTRSVLSWSYLELCNLLK